jgi:hypothetical protein
VAVNADIASASDAAKAAPEPRKRPAWVRVIAVVLVVVGCVLAPISVLGIWARNTLLDTDQYVDTVGPLAENAAIQEAVADRVSERLAASDLEDQVADALPERAAFVAPFVADGLERLVHDLTRRFLESDQFHTLWDEANRRAHRQVLAVLEGEGTETVRTRNGQVVLELGPVIDRVQRALDDRGIDVFDQESDRVPREFVLFESEGLRSAQSGVRLLRRLTFTLPVVSLLFLGGGILLSVNRRQTMLKAALGVALAIALVLTGANLGRDVYLDAIENAGRSRDAGAAAFDQVLSYLRVGLRATFALGIVIAIGAWLAGPGRFATRIRTVMVRLVRSGGEGEFTAVGRFTRAYRVPLRVLVVGLGLLVLVVLSHPGPLAVLVVAVAVLLALLLIEFLGRHATEGAGV